MTDQARGPAELVVLLDPAGRPIGSADKASVHDAVTPYHLAFSCYAFGPDDRLLMTRRARTKRTWPGVWSNTCCGHPAPGEPVADAVDRRMSEELGLRPGGLRLVLPDFAYRVSARGVEENELCPVFLCRVARAPTPRPDEVDDWRWSTWDDYVRAATARESALSPWTRLQVAELLSTGAVERYLTVPPPAQ